MSKLERDIRYIDRNFDTIRRNLIDYSKHISKYLQ